MENIKSIIKAAHILELFLANREVMTLGEIARATGLNKTTVSRVVSTLVSCSFLKQQKRRGKYSLGVRFLDFSEFIKTGSKEGLDAISYLIELSRLVNLSIYLIIWHGTDVMYNNILDYFQGSTEVAPYDWKDKPLHSTCVGKIILASMNDEEFKKYIQNVSIETNGMGIEQIVNSVLTVRREGIAVETQNPGINSIAVGIRNQGDEIVGVIFLTGPSYHFNHALLTQSIPTLKNCALKISRNLGYRTINVP
jgi:IclR family transcriptional regulator, KDG regulon repressor